MHLFGLIAATARACALIGLAALGVGCSPGAVSDSAPPQSPPPDTSDTGGGTVQRAALDVQLTLDPLDAAAFTASGASLAGLVVRAQRRFSAEAAQTAVTDVAGRVRLNGLLGGDYSVEVDRPLTEEEQLRLPVADRELSVFAAGADVRLAPPQNGTVVLSLTGSRRGSLVLSEVYYYYAGVLLGGDGMYWEFYNQGDTTVYLDGMLLFHSNLQHANSPEANCATINAEERLTPDGVWASFIKRFPGRGRDFPVPPGSYRVVASNAIDHTSVGLGMQDLRRAQFELIGNDADPNNPQAADMIHVSANLGFNGGFPSARALHGIAIGAGLDTSTMPRRFMQGWISGVSNSPYYLVPREQIVDVMGFLATPESYARTGAYSAGVRTCWPFAHPSFEQAPNQLVDERIPHALRRRAIGRTSQGHEILMRTGTSARDFELGEPLARSLKR